MITERNKYVTITLGQFHNSGLTRFPLKKNLGEDELAKGVVSLKDMDKSEQREVKIEDIFEEITK